MTKKDSHPQTWTLKLDQKITPTNLNRRTWPKYGWILTKNILIYFGQILNHKPVALVILFYFLISVIFTRYCSFSVIVCRCDLFGHVQIFWSYSFGHLRSVKWVFPSFSGINFYRLKVFYTIGPKSQYHESGHQSPHDCLSKPMN